MRSSACCARPCWPARTRRPAPTVGSPKWRACCCPTPTRSWPSARRTRLSRAATTCPCSNYLPLLARFYGGQRAAFLRFLAHVAPVSTSQDRATEQAIAFLLAHRTDRRAKLRTTVEATQADGAVVRRPLDLSWVGEKWWPLLTGRTARDPAPTEVDRRH